MARAPASSQSDSMSKSRMSWTGVLAGGVDAGEAFDVASTATAEVATANSERNANGASRRANAAQRGAITIVMSWSSRGAGKGTLVKSSFVSSTTRAAAQQVFASEYAWRGGATQHERCVV